MGTENRGRLGKGRAFQLPSKYARGEALPNERRIHPALSRLGVIFSSARESSSLAPILPSHPAAPAEPPPRWRWQGRPVPGCPPPPGAPSGKAAATLLFGGTACDSGACSFTPHGTERAVIPPPPPPHPANYSYHRSHQPNSWDSVFVIPLACKSALPGGRGGSRGIPPTTPPRIPLYAGSILVPCPRPLRGLAGGHRRTKLRDVSVMCGTGDF